MGNNISTNHLAFGLDGWDILTADKSAKKYIQVYFNEVMSKTHIVLPGTVE